MKKLTQILALGMMVSMASGAGALTTDGDWSDWFSYTGDQNDLVTSPNWDESRVDMNLGMIRTVVDEEGPTPGGGGQRYDTEQIFYYFEDLDANDPNSGGRLHVGLVTGFPPAGVPSDDLYGGDLFVGLGGAGGLQIGDFDFAVATSTANIDRGQAGSVAVNTTDDIDYFGTTWANTGGWGQRTVVVNDFGASNPYRMNESGSGFTDVTNDVNTQIAWGGIGQHNFLEVSFNIDGVLENQITGDEGGLRLHWTMECGNDVINVQDNTPLAPVPEPSTMVLLGMGVMGAIMRKKFTA